MHQKSEQLEIRPADWGAFKTVMGEKGGCGGCWCMLWRQSKRQMDAGMGARNKAAMKAVFDSGHIPGLIAYADDRPVGWIQVDARTAFPRLESSRILKQVDDAPVWCVSCFFIHKDFRRARLSAQLLRAATDFAKSGGATYLEGYPIDPPKTSYPPVYAWTGFAGAFRDNGFIEIARNAKTRPIMRKKL